MKPFVEQVSNRRDFSWRLERYVGACTEFEWHYHLEYEIVILRHGLGRLFAGSHNQAYRHNTMALFGPRLPHTTYIEELLDESQAAETIVLWFSHEWVSRLMKAMPDLQPLKGLLENAGHGLLFTEAFCERMYNEIQSMTGLTQMQQSWRIIDILIQLAQEPQSVKLNPVVFSDQIGDQKNQDRIAKALNFIENNYQNSVTIDQLATHLHMSKSSVQRLFEKHFNECFSEHLKLYRIGKACEMLINTRLAIALVSEQTGFGNLSNFNRQFRKCKNMTPRQFREQFRKAA